MARRASNRLNPGIIMGAVVAVAAAIFAGKSLLTKKATTFSGINPLSMDELLENGNQLRGSDYVVQGQIDEKLQWTTSRGQLVSVKVDTPGGEQFIGIEIPPEFNNLNIETKQKYSFRVKFRHGGVAVATGINRL